MYEFFDHTADLGMRVRAKDLEGLLEQAAEGLVAMVVEPAVDPEWVDSRRFDVDGDREDWLLFDWLSEVLVAIDCDRIVLGAFRVRLRDGGLRAEARARPLDPERDRPLHEVKAITYHGLRVERVDGQWLAEVIVDI